MCTIVKEINVFERQKSQNRSNGDFDIRILGTSNLWTYKMAQDYLKFNLKAFGLKKCGSYLGVCNYFNRCLLQP